MCLYSRRCKQGNVVDVARAAGNFKTLLKILSELEVPSEDPRLKPMTLLDILKMQREVTVFAPTDEAFAKVEGHLNSQLFNPKPKLYIPSTPNNSNETHTFMCLGRTGRFGQR